MALADIVLEGLTLILVIALGAVLIGGLSYLTTTTASTNNARLITAGTYVYLAGPTYINGTLYVPMYNIGEYTVEVKYLFVKGLNGVQEYATNIILKPGQYYVYELSIDYTPKAVTIVVSPMRDPKLALEFNSNVSTPGPIALTPIGQGGSSNCPILAIVSDSQNAGWEVAWTMASGTYSVSESTSYQWCILPSYYPITINFQSTITNNPSNYQCQISPQTAQVNYNGTPTTVPFTVTCQQSRTPSPPPPPPGGGNNNNNYFVYVTVTGDSYGAGWEVSSGDYDITGTGNVNNEKLAIIGPGITIRAWITSNPSGYTCTISPGSYSNVQNGSTYTFTVSCQPITTSGPYCIVNPSASDNVGGESGASVSPSTTQYIPPGQSVLFSWTAQNNPVQYNGQTYYFNNWAATLNGQSIQTTSPQYLSTSYTFTCPSTLSSSQTYTLSGTAYYWKRYLQVGGGNTFNVPGSGTFPITSQYTTAYFYWSDPLFISGSWSISYQQGGDSFTINVQLNDVYSESAIATPLTASTTLAIQGPPGYACSINGISPTQGSINIAQTSYWLPTSAYVNVTCVPQNGKGQ